MQLETRFLKAVLFVTCLSCFAYPEDTAMGSGQTLFEPGNQNTAASIELELTELLANLYPELLGAKISVSEASGRVHWTVSVPKRKDDARFGEFLERCKDYVSIRAAGHSSGYSQFLTSGMRALWPSKYDALIARESRHRKQIAYPWIRLDIKTTIAFPEEAKNNPFVVVDGEVAWIYIPAVDSREKVGMEFFKFRIDALEFAPGVRPLMQRLYSERTKLKKTPDGNSAIGIEWWTGYKKTLNTRYGIEWKTPDELNSYIFFN